jgi:hypothetical protein
MKWLLYFLMAYLSPRVEDDFAPGDDDTPPPDDDDVPPPDDDDVPPPDDDDVPPPDDDEPAPEPRISRAQKAIIATRERAQKAESELARVNAELSQARAKPSQPTQDQVLWQQEEETLRNPEATDWQKYAINANRSARQANANSQNALQSAQDLADRTSFAAIAATKPKLFAAYKDRVEEKLKEARANGNNPSRENILRFIVGEDMLSGKIKSMDTKAAKPAAATRANVRSDVSATGWRMSEQEKRAKRLENVRI